MKIGFISDIHGNFKALEAVLDALAAEEVDRIICLGDVATLGPQPRQVLKKLRVLDIECIKGNHDEALSDIENIEDYRIPMILKDTLQWCRDMLNDEETKFISEFKDKIEIPLDTDKILIAYHGTVDSNTIGILPKTAENDALSIISPCDALAMVGGHTHLQMDRIIDNKRVISAGSVGCAFAYTPEFGEEPDLLKVAQFCIVSYSKGDIKVDLKAIPYDIETYIRALRESDLPSKEWWLRQLG